MLPVVSDVARPFVFIPPRFETGVAVDDRLTSAFSGRGRLSDEAP